MKKRETAGRLRHARALRREATSQERRLWAVLRNRQLRGAKFKRQVLLGPYIVDFSCAEARLVIELDGGQHADQVAYDEVRTAFLADRGMRVLRFWNGDIDCDLDGVLAVIAAALGPSPSHPASPGGPLPLPGGERGR